MKRFFLIICIFFSLISCNNKEALMRLQENEEGVQNPTSIEELELAIQKYQRRVDDIMLAQNRVAIWYKMLGTRYIDAKMYKKAVDAFLEALEYYPHNHNLYYQLGLAASQVAKMNVGFSFQESEEKYLSLAIDAYSKCLVLEPEYTKAAYALSVIYTYETGEYEKAVPILEDIVKRESKNYDAFFVLGAAYYLDGDYVSAKQSYQKIIDTAKDKKIIDSAKKNILELEMQY